MASTKARTVKAVTSTGTIAGSKAWTKGIPEAIATKARARLADKGVTLASVATLSTSEDALKAGTEAAAWLKANQRNTWQLVALEFGLALPTAGRGTKAEGTARAAIIDAMGAGDLVAARNKVNRWRWAGILSLFMPQKSDAEIGALAEQATKARDIVTGAEAVPSKVTRKARTKGDGTVKAGTTPKAGTIVVPVGQAKPVTGKALAGALATTPKAVSVSERVRLNRQAAAWLINSQPEGLDTAPIAAWLADQLAAQAKADAIAAEAIAAETAKAV